MKLFWLFSLMFLSLSYCIAEDPETPSEKETEDQAKADEYYRSSRSTLTTILQELNADEHSTLDKASRNDLVDEVRSCLNTMDRLKHLGIRSHVAENQAEQKLSPQEKREATRKDGAGQ